MDLKIPKNQELCLTKLDKDKNIEYIITRDTTGLIYTLYKVDLKGKLEKLFTGNNPTKLEDKYKKL